MKQVNLNNIREGQEKVYEDLAERNVCPFCPHELPTQHPGPYIEEGKYWILTKNRWPYEYSKLSLLFIHKPHIETISEVSPEAAKELFELAAHAKEQFAVESGTLFMRFGDTRYNGATIQHLHAHLFVPDITNKKWIKAYVKVGTNPNGCDAAK